MDGITDDEREVRSQAAGPAAADTLNGEAPASPPAVNGTGGDPGPADKPLRVFYQRLRSGNAVRGLPDDYAGFESALADTNTRRAFYERLRANPSVRGLPDRYERFNGLWGDKEPEAKSQKPEETESQSSTPEDNHIRGEMIKRLQVRESDLRTQVKKLQKASMTEGTTTGNFMAPSLGSRKRISDPEMYDEAQKLLSEADELAGRREQLQEKQLYATGTDDDRAEMDEGTLRKSVEEFAKGAGRGVVNLPKALATLASYNTGNPAQALQAKQMQIALQKVNESETLAPDQEFRNQTLGNIYDNPTKLIPYLSGKVGESAPTMLPGLGAAKLLTGAGKAAQIAGAALASSPIETAAQLEDLEQTAVERKRAPTGGEKALAVATGLLSSAVEGVADASLMRGILKGLNKTGLDDAAGEAAKKEIAEGISDIALRAGSEAGRGFGVEGSTEAVQQVIANAGARYGWDPDRGYFEGVPESIVVGGLTGAPISGVGTAVTESVNKRRYEAAVEQAKRQGLNVPFKDSITQQEEQAKTEAERRRLNVPYRAGNETQQQPADNAADVEGAPQTQPVQPEIGFTYDPEATADVQTQQLNQEERRLADERARAADAGQEDLVKQYEQALGDIAGIKAEVEGESEGDVEAEAEVQGQESAAGGEPTGEQEAGSVEQAAAGAAPVEETFEPVPVSEGRYRVERLQPADVEGETEGASSSLSAGEASEGGAPAAIPQFRVLDNETGEPLSRSSRNFNPAFAEFLTGAEMQAVPRVADGDAEAAGAPASQDAYLETVASEGQNPVELVEAYEDALILKEQVDDSATGQVFEAETYKLRPDDVARVMGSDYLPENRILYTQTSKEGTPLDVQAEIYSDRLGREVTEQEIIEYRLNGLRRSNKFNTLRDTIKERFKDVTGVGLTESLANEVQQRQIQDFLDDDGAILPEVQGLIDNYIDDNGRIDYTSLWDQELQNDSGKGFFTGFPGELNEEQYQRLKDEVEAQAKKQAGSSEQSAARRTEGTAEADGAAAADGQSPRQENGEGQERAARGQQRIDTILEGKDVAPIEEDPVLGDAANADNTVQDEGQVYGQTKQYTEAEGPDGQPIGYVSLAQESASADPAQGELQFGAEGNQENASPHTLGDEFYTVKRGYRPDKNWKLTGRSSRIRNIDDVAYLMRSLETSSVEQYFVVAVGAGGEHILLHVSSGTSTAALSDLTAIQDAVNKVDATDVYFVHNHPSGNLRSSAADRNQFEVIDKMFSGTTHGVIMDAYKGEYLVFNPSGVGDQTQARPENTGEDISYEVQRFDKAIYGQPVETGGLTSPSAVASFLTGSRYSIGDKTVAILLSNSKEINAVVPLTDTSEAGILAKVKQLMPTYNSQSVILAGRKKGINVHAINRINEQLQIGNIEDYVMVDTSAGNAGNYRSMRSGRRGRVDRSRSTIQDTGVAEPGTSFERQQLERQFEQAKKEYAAARTAFNSKQRELDGRLADDRANLFGERQTDSSTSMFDMRADPAQVEKTLQPFRDRREAAKQQVNRLAKKLEQLPDTADPNLFDAPSSAARGGDATGRVREAELPSNFKPFDEAIEEYLDGSISPYTILNLGSPSASLQRFGIPKLPITISQRVLKKGQSDRHSVSDAIVKDLPSVINNPMMSIKGEADGKRTIISNVLTDKGQPVLTGFEVEAEKSGVKVNDIRSFYGKKIKSLLQWIDEGRLEKVNKKEALRWISVLSGPNDQNTAYTQGLLEKVRRIIENSNDIDDTSSPAARGGDATGGVREAELPSNFKPYDEVIESYWEGNLQPSDILTIGIASDKLQSAGISSNPIVITQGILNKIADKDVVSRAIINNLPAIVNNPMMVVNPYESETRKALISPVQTKDGPVLVALNLDSKKGKIEVTDVRSVYGKRASDIVKWVADGKLEAVDKNKALQWFDQLSGSNSPGSVFTNEGLKENIRSIIENSNDLGGASNNSNGPGGPRGSRLNDAGAAYSDDIGAEGRNPQAEGNARADTGGGETSSPIVVTDANGVGRKVQLGHLDKIQGMAMPELVRMVHELTGQVPGISTRFRSSRGKFYPVEGGGIGLSADIFQDTTTATKVLGHEIGHLIDYLPEETMSRGNLLGRLKSLRRFLKTTAEGSQSTGPGLTKKDRNRLRNEATRAVVEEEGVALSEYIQDKEIRDRFSERIKKRYKEYVTQEIRDRKLLSQEGLFNELYAHSKDWRPFDENAVDDSYRRYRRSSAELYADALSALLTSPGTLEQNAPTFYNEFFAQLEEKPAVKSTYLETQAYLNGGNDAVQALRNETVEVAYQKAEEKTKQLIEEREKAGQSYVSEIKQSLVDKWHPIIKKLDEAEKAGQTLPVDEDPRYLLQEFDYADNASTIYLYDVGQQVVNPVEEAGMSTLDLHKYLLFNRIANEGVEAAGQVEGEGELTAAEQEFMEASDKELDEQRKQYGRAFMANPGGLTAETAQEQLDFMRENLGEASFDALEQAAQRFQELNFAQVEEAVEQGSYSREIFEKLIKPNKYNYATFRVIDYIEYPDYVNAAVKASKGTFKEVGSTFDASLLKTLSLIQLNQAQKAKLGFRNTWQDMFPDEISKAEETAPGRFRTPPDKGAIEMLEDGKKVVYNVDPYIADAFAYTPRETFNWFVRFTRWTNESIYRPLFITYNPAFTFWSNPNRDFKRMYRNIPEASLGEVIKGYIDSWQDAKDFSKGNLDNPRLQRLVDEFAIAPPGEGMVFKNRGDALGRQMERFHLLDGEKNWVQKQTEKYKALRWWPKMLSWIRTKGSHIEILPKLAADRILQAKGATDKERAYRIRNYFGTPNFKAGGRSKSTTNSIWMFSNIFMQGYKADAQVATNPKTRGAFWMRTAMLDILPKLFIRGAILGWFGDELKEFYDKATEYDKTNYVVIPMGWQEGGSTGRKPVYLRVPQDESARLVSSMVWKLTGVMADQPENDLTQVFDLGADEIPSISPFWITAGKWGEYLSGKNPQDDWRDRGILPQRVQDARKVDSGPALKKMVEWTINSTGLTSIATYNPNADNTTEFIMQTAPILNRMIKATDYGALESQNAEEDLENARKQAIRLGYGEEVLNMVSRTYYLRRLGDKRFGNQNFEYGYLNNFYQQVYKPMDEQIRLQREEGNDEAAKKLIDDLQGYAEMYEEMIDKSEFDRKEKKEKAEAAPAGN